MTRESAVLIAVSAAEDLVGPWRAEHDESAGAGVPAHITLLFPFVRPERLDAHVVGELRELFAETSPFGFTLARTARFGEPGTEEQILYLEPEPSTPFVRLTESVAARFPGFPPYAGAHDVVVPHLTVAQSMDDGLISGIEAALAPGLPIETEAREATLMEQGRDGMWRVRERLAFASRG